MNNEKIAEWIIGIGLLGGWMTCIGVLALTINNLKERLTRKTLLLGR